MATSDFLDKFILLSLFKLSDSGDSIKTFLTAFSNHSEPLSQACLLGLPYVYLDPVKSLAADSGIILGANEMNSPDLNAFTGSIAAKTLKNKGIHFVLIGAHKNHGQGRESDMVIRQKIQRALQADICPFLCIGETLEHVEQNESFDVIKEQVQVGLNGLTAEQLKKVVIVCEAPWVEYSLENLTEELLLERYSLYGRVLSECLGQDAYQKLNIIYCIPEGLEEVNKLLSTLRPRGFYTKNPSQLLAFFGDHIAHHTQNYESLYMDLVQDQASSIEHAIENEETENLLFAAVDNAKIGPETIEEQKDSELIRESTQHVALEISRLKEPLSAEAKAAPKEDIVKGEDSQESVLKASELQAASSSKDQEIFSQEGSLKEPLSAEAKAAPRANVAKSEDRKQDALGESELQAFDLSAIVEIDDKANTSTKASQSLAALSQEDADEKETIPSADQVENANMEFKDNAHLVVFDEPVAQNRLTQENTSSSFTQPKDTKDTAKEKKAQLERLQAQLNWHYEEIKDSAEQYGDLKQEILKRYEHIQEALKQMDPHITQHIHKGDTTFFKEHPEMAKEAGGMLDEILELNTMIEEAVAISKGIHVLIQEAKELRSELETTWGYFALHGEEIKNSIPDFFPEFPLLLNSKEPPVDLSLLDLQSLLSLRILL